MCTCQLGAAAVPTSEWAQATRHGFSHPVSRELDGTRAAETDPAVCMGPGLTCLPQHWIPNVIFGTLTSTSFANVFLKTALLKESGELKSVLEQCEHLLSCIS